MADIGYVLLVGGGTIACDAVYVAGAGSPTAANTIMAANPGSVLHINTVFPSSNQPFYGLTTVVEVGQSRKLFGGRASGTCASTDLTIKTGTYTGNIHAANSNSGEVTGTAKLTIERGATVGALLGGGDGASSTAADTEVIVRGITTNYAAGGGTGGVVTGSTKVLLQGGTVARPVYGGGINATATVGTAATPTGSTYVELSSYTADDLTTDALVTQYICGGGQLGDVYGNTHVSIKGGTANQNVFGGGYCNLSTKVCGLVHGNTNVEVSGGKVGWSVYGGGYGGTFSGTATISITGGEFSATSRVFGGSYVTLAGGTIHDYNQTSDVTLNAADVTVQRLAGGACVTIAEAVTLTGDTKVTLAQGTVSQAVVGRANAYGGAAVTDGGANTVSTVDITGGQAHIVAGAGLVTAASTTYAYTGNTVINVSGGEVDYLFGGNVGSKTAFCTNTTMNGDVAITVDTSEETVTLKYLYAGSNSSSTSKAKQNGNTTVTFTGLGSNLIWTEGGISGDGSGKYSDIDKSQYTRTLLFDGFTGAFAAPQISRFDTIAFGMVHDDDDDPTTPATITQSNVTFTSASLNLSGVETWQFGLGSSLTWNDGTNSFANDALIFGDAGDNISTDWEVMTSNNNKVFAGWGRANIMLFGTALDTYDDDTGTWSAEGFDYVAKWDDENHKIIIAQA